MKSRYVVLAGLITFIVVAGVATWFWLRPAPALPELKEASAPFQKRAGPPALIANSNLNGLTPRSPISDWDLMVRTASDTGSVVVRFPNPVEMYRYDIITKTITRASEPDWLAGENEVSCRHQSYTQRNIPIFIDDPKGTLHDMENRSDIKTAAAIALMVSEAPESSRMAVLSATGPRTPFRPDLIFGGGGGEARGRRYVQILDPASRQYITQPVGLEGIKEFPSYRFCWPGGGKTLVVYEVDFDNTNEFPTAFHVIETGR